MSTLENAERVLASVAGLALFALNDVRMFHLLPRVSDPSNDQVHAVSLQLLGASEQAYATLLDLVVRWGLAGLTVSLCVWALVETLQRPAKTA